MTNCSSVLKDTEIDIVQALPEDVWRGFVQKQPTGNIFHTPEMFSVFARAKGFDPAVWAALCEGEILAVFVPVQVTLNGLPKLLTTRAISYGSVLCSPTEEGHQALSLLLQNYVQATRWACLFTELRNIADLESEQPILQHHGFAYERHLNYLICLEGGPEETFLRIGPRTRKNIKRALKRGEVTIREAVQPEDINDGYGLLSKTYRAAKVPLADCSLFSAAFELLRPRGMIRMALAYVDGIPAAVTMELLYKNMIYGWYGGMDRAYSSYVPNDLLMWDVLKWGAENGYSVYDFGGAGSPEEEYGVREFKAKFGGKLVCYGRNIRVHRPGILWLSKQGYRVARQVFSGSL